VYQIEQHGCVFNIAHLLFFLHVYYSIWAALQRLYHSLFLDYTAPKKTLIIGVIQQIQNTN
jgi:hypothetical protein